jgi:two-component system, OmpR family, phosphate regulon sensor histidine kinase PhoR
VTIVALILLVLLAVAIVAAMRERRRLIATEHHFAGELREQRERFEAAQHDQTARQEAMLDSMVEGLLVLDGNGRIVLANEAAQQMFRFSRMMVGGTVLEAIRHHEVAALATRALTSDHALEHEVRIELPQPRIVQISAVALHSTRRENVGAVLVFHDVTRLRQLEAMRQDFVANVSHELRTPLSLIKSAAETLIDGGKNDPAVTTRFLDMIDRHANRLTLLIDDLLLLAQLDSDRVELKLQPLPLRTAAQDALDDAALIAKSRQVTLENQVPAGVIAHADPERLRQVLWNLIDNAIKYGRAAGHVVIRGRVVDAEQVELSVRDDGPGIPLDAKERIFERFYRVDKARSREQGGTGLGLAIVKNLVQAHRGTVRVETAPGAGTEFFITLPARSETTK